MKKLRFAVAALLLVAGTGAAALPHAQGSCAGGTYRVVRGDTLYSIARLCGRSVAEIAGANRLSGPRIAPGQRLAIRRAEPDPGEQRGEVLRADEDYRIQAGDTLYSLARWARIGLPALLAANPGIDPRAIEIGDAVRLPRGAVRPGPQRLRERGPPRAEPPPLVDEEDEPDDADKPDGEEEEPEPEGM